MAEHWAPRSHELRDLFQRNAVSYAFMEPESAEGQALLAEVGRTEADPPVVVLLDGQALVTPTNVEFAAAVNAASEGLSTLVVDREAIIGGAACPGPTIRFQPLGEQPDEPCEWR